MKDKIRALLALAADPSAAPQEAENASRMAAKLMAKHQISLGDLEEEALKAEFDLTQAYARACRPGKKNAKVIPPWIGIIAWGVKLYTRTRLRSLPGGQIRFQGPREDVELAVWLHELLLDSAYKASQGSDQPNAFRNGFAGAIQARLKAMMTQRDQVDAEHTGTALVRVQGKRETLMAEAFGPDTHGRSSKVSQSMAGRAAGAAAHIPTGRPVSAAQHRSLT